MMKSFINNQDSQDTNIAKYREQVKYGNCQTKTTKSLIHFKIPHIPFI